MSKWRVDPSKCLGCLIEEGKLDASAFSLLLTKHFMVNQNFEVPIPGFYIISTRRHIFSVDEFTEEECAEFARILKLIRQGMREALDVKIVYLFQNEAGNSHFHLWIFPRLEWMEKFGANVESVHNIINYAKANMRTKETFEQAKISLDKMEQFVQKNWRT